MTWLETWVSNAVWRGAWDVPMVRMIAGAAAVVLLLAACSVINNMSRKTLRCLPWGFAGLLWLVLACGCSSPQWVDRPDLDVPENELGAVYTWFDMDSGVERIVRDGQVWE